MPTACPAKTWLKLIFFAIQANSTAAGDHDGFVMERIVDAYAQPQPPDGELAQVEQRMRGRKGHAVITANVGGQAALFKKPFQHSKSVVFSGGGKGLAGQ
jgi:hypothetical protein